MPAAVPFVIGGAFAIAAGATLKAVLIASVIGFGFNRLFKPKMQGLANAYQDGTRANVANSIQEIPIVYGSLERIPGALAFIETSDYAKVDDNHVLNLVLVWGEGDFNDITNLYLNDYLDNRTAFTQDGINHILHINHHTGADGQAADADLMARIPSLWTTGHRLRGIAYSYVALKWNQEVFPSGIPTITANVVGRQVTDARTDPPDSSTDNPALVLLDYLKNKRFGCGIAAADIDLDSFHDAANYCDENIGPTLGVAGAFKRYVCGGLLSPEDSRLSNIEAILSSMRGILIYTGGTYRLVLDRPAVPTFDLNETNIVGPMQISLDAEGLRFNRVQVSFINKLNKSQPDIRIVDSPTFLANDNGEVLMAQLDLPMTTHEVRARMLANMELKASRYSMRVVLTAIASALRCEVGDLVALTHSVPGWTGKYLRVEQMELLSNDEVRLTLKEYDLSVYDIGEDAVVDVPPGTTLPDPRYVAPVPYILTVEQETINANYSMVTLAWETGEGTNFLDGFTVEWRKQAVGGRWRSHFMRDTETNGWVTSSAGEGEYFLWTSPPLRRGITWQFRVRARNTLGVHSQGLLWNVGVV